MTRTNLVLVAKTISWRIIASCTTFAVVYAFSGSLPMATVIGLFDAGVKIVFYYLHERFWLARYPLPNDRL